MKICKKIKFQVIFSFLLIIVINSIVIIQASDSAFQTVQKINEWTNMAPTGIPGGRLDSQLVYDSKADKFILFSGLRIPGLHADTWTYEYGSNTWTNMSPSTLPPALPEYGGYGRNAYEIAYDEESDQVILFSGSEKGPPDWTSWNDTWSYNLNENTWINQNPSIQPIGRAYADMVYDSNSDRIILFGGLMGDTIYAETWAYDFNTNTWTNMNPTTSPLPRWAHKMAYDRESDRIILYGGSKTLPPSLVLLNDTWAYDYDTNTWTNMTPSVAPPALQSHGLTYDSKSDRIILFGGGDSTMFSIGETWVYNFNSNTWINETSDNSLGPRRRFAMAYDEQSDRTILFGGFYGGMVLNETWSLNYQLDDEPPTTTTTTSTTTTTTIPESNPSFTFLTITIGFMVIFLIRKKERR